VTPPLLVVALGGNALSAPTGALTLAEERANVRAACAELAALAADGLRLLVVHGNGPQVGRLLRAGQAVDDLDVLVAQTQGELGYLLAAALTAATGDPVHALISRTIVAPDDAAFAMPDKPVGPWLAQRPEAAAVASADGSLWRRVVASPIPLDVPEWPAIRVLLDHGHVIAGGGGGVAVSDADAAPLPAVVDKDRIATWLAIRLAAAHLLFATDVAGVLDGFATPQARLVPHLGVADALARVARGDYPAGSMAPKVASAAAFVAATGRPALIAAVGDLAAAWAGQGGTRIG
jgi:carbamate kinase